MRPPICSCVVLSLLVWLSSSMPSVAAEDSKPEPTAHQTFHTAVGGGLIDGSCVGIAKDHKALIKTMDGQQFQVPLELFELNEQKTLCAHFGVDLPREGEPVKPTPADRQHPWHSFRGGVMAMGVITGVDERTLIVVDNKGKRFRVPYDMLASGAKLHADRDLDSTKLKIAPLPATPKLASDRRTNRQDEKPTSKPEKPPKVAKSREKPASNSATPAVVVTPPVPPVPVAPPTPPATVAAPASTPDPAAAPDNKHPVRKWKMTSGVPIAEGKFVELKDGRVTILRSDNRPMPLPLDLLCEADRQYAKTIAAGGEPGKVPAGALPIESETARLVRSLDSKSLLLVDGRQLRRLSEDGRRVIAVQELPEGVTQVAERPEYLVAAAGKHLLLLDKRSLKVIATHELWKIRGIRALALHPQRKIAFLSIENGIDEIRNNDDERQRIVSVDEKSGDVDELDGYYASFLAVDPAGKFLLAGYKRVTERVGDIRINPGLQVVEIPKWENTDILTRYRIQSRGLEIDERFPNAGANGQGVVVSPDGRRVAYLSYTGYPTYSGNVALLALGDFKKKPVSLAMKDRADCKRLVFHPTLRIAASPAENAAAVFDIASGSLLDDALDVPPTLTGAAIHDMAFSPDGKQLVCIASQGGGEHFLATAALTIDPKAFAPTAPQPPAEESSPFEELVEVIDPAAERTWKDNSGKFSLVATYAGMEGPRVKLRKADGTVAKILLEKLSESDQNLIRHLQKK